MSIYSTSPVPLPDVRAYSMPVLPVLVVAEDAATGQRLKSIAHSATNGAEVVCATTCEEASAALTSGGFAFAVVDLQVDDALELILRIRQDYGHTRVVAVAPIDRNDAVMAALHAGANGYIVKEREDVELILSLKSLQRGGTPIDPDAVHWILSLVPRPPGVGASAGVVRLSGRELEVLQLLARGCSNREIAGLISLSRLTVEGYIKSLYRKLGVGSRTAAVFEAQRLRLLC